MLEVAPLFDQLFSMDGVAYSVALDLMGMYVHGAHDRLENLRPQLLAAITHLNKRLKRRGSQMDAHHFKQLIEWLLKKGRDDDDARIAAIGIARYAVVDPDGNARDLIKPLLPTLLSMFPSIVWPIFGNAIIGDRRTAWRVEHLLGDSFSFADRKHPAVMSVPEDVLFAWCHTNQDRAPAFLAGVIPILVTRQPQPGGNALHPLTQRLIDEFGDRDDVLKALVRNMYTFGWAGSRSKYFTLYEAPLRALETHRIGGVRRWAKKMIDRLRDEIDAARTEDAEEQADWDV
ncbi:hypothetical protein ACF1BQ_025465 [Bradyrhizobium sp. RDT10]